MTSSPMSSGRPTVAGRIPVLAVSRWWAAVDGRPAVVDEFVTVGATVIREGTTPWEPPPSC